MKHYRNYIFDLYGTLADIRTDENSPVLWRKTAFWYAQHGALYTGGQLWRRYLAFCEAEQAKHDDPFYEIELRNVFRALFAEKNVAADEDLIRSTAIFFRIESTRKLRLYPWVMPTLRKLRAAGKRLYLLSNAQACFTGPELKALGLADLFDGILLSSDAGVKKPSLQIMETLLETYDLRAEESLFTGNDQHSDIALAKAFAMDCLYLETETSGTYKPSLTATYEFRRGEEKKIPAFFEAGM